MALISVNIKELNTILETTPALQNIMLAGKHGIGKSEILTNFFSSKGMKTTTLFLGQMSDPGDLIGLPRLDEKTGKTVFMPPYWFPTDNQPIVLFLDELNRARPEVLQTIMDLALNRRLAGRELPEGSRLISAVNDGDEYQLTELDPALISRFNIYLFRPSVAEWLLWAEQTHLDQRVIGFIQENNNLLDGIEHTENDNGLEKTPDRRAWKKVSDCIKSKEDLSNLNKFIAGIIGVKATSLFYNYLQNHYIISAENLLLNGFDKKKISTYKLTEIATLNEAIFRYIESNDIESPKETISKNLDDYCDFLLKNKKKEEFAHFISVFESGNYPKAISFILLEIPGLYESITNFISEL